MQRETSSAGIKAGKQVTQSDKENATRVEITYRETLDAKAKNSEEQAIASAGNAYKKG